MLFDSNFFIRILINDLKDYKPIVRTYTNLIVISLTPLKNAEHFKKFQQQQPKKIIQ